MIEQFNFRPKQWYKQYKNKTVCLYGYQKHVLDEAISFCKKFKNKVYYIDRTKESAYVKWITPYESYFYFSTVEEASWFSLRFSEYVFKE